MDNKRASELLEKYFANTCTQEERDFVERHYNSLISSNEDFYGDEELSGSYNRGWNQMQERMHPGRRARRAKLYAYGSAAAVVIGIFVGYYFITTTPNQPAEIKMAKVLKDVEPGGNHAVLTLPNGQRIDLQRSSNGKISNNLNILIQKTNEGELVYTRSEISKSATISTPKGGQFTIKLPDGSKVWLNAASSLTFPSNFEGSAARNVQLKGEAYFEVAHNQSKPFIVETASQKVKVLGTHFNINAYDDEPSVKTTLLQGSVQILPLSTQLKSAILKPGQQAILHQNDEILIRPEDPYASSWKDGLVRFKDADFKSIMRQVGRWYDIEIVYKSPYDHVKFSGGIDRKKNLSTFLTVLEYSKIRYSIIDGAPKQLIIE